MIIINSAMQQENIKQLLEGLNEEGISYTLKKKKEIQLIFEITGNCDLAKRKAKDAIKATDWGHVLYFNVV